MDKLSKKEKRIESKKRKAAAFLQLAKQAEEVKKEIEDSDDESCDSKKPKMTDVTEVQQKSKPLDELAQYRQLLRDKKKASMEKPKVYLLLDELQFQHSRQISQDMNFKELPPLFMLDLQHLLLFAIQGNISSYKPRWCRLLRVGKVNSVIVIVLDAVSSYEFQTYPDCFPRLKAEFDMSTDMVSPEQYGSTVADDLFNVPLSNSVLSKINGVLPKKTRNTINKLTKPPGYFGTENLEEKSNVTSSKEDVSSNQKQTEISLLTVFSHADIDASTSSLHKNDTFTRTSLLLNSTQMIAEDFPLPIQYGSHGTYDDFVFSKDSYTTVNSRSPMFAIDGEMCITTTKKYELTRVSVVNEKLETIYDSYVKPYNKITDYVTRYSGVTKFILDPVQTRLEDVQKFLQETLPPDAIICGQSLKGDFTALKMFHPYVIDTSVIYNLSGHRSQKTSLKRLASHFLGKDIQESTDGHSSVEDATTAMELVQLKLSQTPTFGDIVNGGAIYPVLTKNEDSSSLDCQKDETVDLTNDNDDNNIKKEKHTKDKNSDKKQDKLNTDSERDLEKQDKNSNTEKCLCGDKNVEKQTSCKHCDAEKGSNHSKNRQSIIQQRKAFFQQAGSQVYENLFKLTKQQDKMVGLIDRAETLEQYKDETITAIPTNCDKDTKSSGKSLVQFHAFVYMNFPSYKDAVDSIDEAEKMKILRKQDKRMSKVLKNVRNNSLVAVVMSGRCSEGQDYSAKTFVKIT